MDTENTKDPTPEGAQACRQESAVEYIDRIERENDVNARQVSKLTRKVGRQKDHINRLELGRLGLKKAVEDLNSTNYRLSQENMNLKDGRSNTQTALREALEKNMKLFQEGAELRRELASVKRIMAGDYGTPPPEAILGGRLTASEASEIVKRAKSPRARLLEKLEPQLKPGEMARIVEQMDELSALVEDMERQTGTIDRPALRHHLASSLSHLVPRWFLDDFLDDVLLPQGSHGGIATPLTPTGIAEVKKRTDGANLPPHETGSLASWAFKKNGSKPFKFKEHHLDVLGVKVFTDAALPQDVIVVRNDGQPDRAFRVKDGELVELKPGKKAQDLCVIFGWKGRGAEEKDFHLHAEDTADLERQVASLSEEGHFPPWAVQGIMRDIRRDLKAQGMDA